MLRLKNHPRPFADVDAMNAALVENYNRVVAANAYVFLLGDLSAGGASRSLEYLSQLKGKKFWVPGNHDADIRYKAKLVSCFERVLDIMEVRVPDVKHPDGEQAIMLCHYPFESWNKMHYGSWHLHGHSHGNLRENLDLKRLDVGVDACARRKQDMRAPPEGLLPHDYAPIDYNEVKFWMAQRGFKPVDHHGREDYYGS